MWRGPESGLPGARAGSRRACVGLTVVWYAININENMHVAAKNFYTTDRTVQWLRPLILDKIWSKKHVARTKSGNQVVTSGERR